MAKRQLLANAFGDLQTQRFGTLYLASLDPHQIIHSMPSRFTHPAKVTWLAGITAFYKGPPDLSPI